MLWVAPGCLYIFRGEKVNRNSPLRSQLLSNRFRQFCNTDQAYYVPLPVCRANPHSILPGLWSAELLLPFSSVQASMGQALLKRIRPGTTGFRFTRAKESSVFRKTAEGLMRCCPNLSMANGNLWGLKETTVKIMKGLTWTFQTTGVRRNSHRISEP